MIEIDKIELVKGVSKEVINSKLNKVLSELSKYILVAPFLVNLLNQGYLANLRLPQNSQHKGKGH